MPMPILASRCEHRAGLSRVNPDAGARYGLILFFREKWSLTCVKRGEGACAALPSMHMHAPIDRDIGTGDKSRLLRAQKRDQRRHFIRTPQPSDRNLGKDLRVEN